MPDWDAKYSSPHALFGDGPNEYVREIRSRSDFTARSALCLADGDGRNGCWLAARGLAVTALDMSKVATEKARARDAAAGITVERVVADLADWAAPAGRRWDAAFIIYLQCDLPTRTRALQHAAAVLAPGGWLVIEAFAKGAAGCSGLGLNDRSVLYDLEDIETAVPDLQVVEALTGRILLDEGVRHQGEAEVVRFAARKRD